MSVFSVTYGNQTFDKSSARAGVFLLAPSVDGKASKRETPAAVLEGQRVGKTPSATVNVDKHGAWYQYNYTSIDGVVVQLQLIVTFKSAVVRRGSMLIRLREDGPLIQIKAKVPQHVHATVENGLVTMFSGSGDVLGPLQAAELGIIIESGIIRAFYDREDVEECFLLETLAGEKAPVPKVAKVVDHKGEEKTVIVKSQRARRLRLRRRTR